MPGITIAVELDAPPEVVWGDVADLASHVEWMADAHAIDFTSAQTEGEGTTFDCETRIGPVRLTDKMVITSWKPRAEMGVRHEGVVTGVGRFTLEPVAERTRFTWTEELVFPWWLAGRLGATVAQPVLRAVWRRNLRRLAERFADGRRVS